MDEKELNKALSHLKKDKRLAEVIARHPKYAFDRGQRRLSAYQALTRAIIFQQLSGKAAGTILKRFVGLYPGTRYPKPEEVLETPVSKMRSAGLSGQKTEYLKDLSRKFLDGTINPRKFKSMTDEEISEHVIAVKGIGQWTADMFLIFTLNRPDILPTGDLGVRKGFQRLFKLKELPTPEKMEKLAEPWRPYRTIACWYLWRLADERNKE